MRFLDKFFFFSLVGETASSRRRERPGSLKRIVGVFAGNAAVTETHGFPFDAVAKDETLRSARTTNLCTLVSPSPFFLPRVLGSLAGLVVVMNKQVAHSIDLSNAFTFASGALLAASFLHIIPEAMEGLAGEGVSLHDLGLDAGLSILVGLFLSICIRAMLETGDTEGVIDSDKKAPADGTAVTGEEQTTVIKHQCGTARPRLSASANLWELISARKGRSIFSLKGLHPVVWNVIAGDLVRGGGGC